MSRIRYWYFVRLAFLAIPWELKHNKAAKGTLFKQYHLLQARSIESAFKKANLILSVSENRSGEAKLRGKRVIYLKVGILNLEPVYQKLSSGVEIFDESERDVSLACARKQVLSRKSRIRLIKYEKKKGKPTLLDVYWGRSFNRD